MLNKKKYKIKKILIKSVLALSGATFGICLFFLILEIGLRYFSLFGFEPDKNDMGLNTPGNYAQFQPADDILLGWEFNSENSNKLGFQDMERTVEKSTDTIRICIVGDSITQQSNFFGENGFVRNIETRLNAISSKYNYEVWNCGVGGYGIVQYYAVLRNKILGFDPDLIIIAFCLNDLENPVIIFQNDKGDYLCYRNSYGIFTIPVNTSLFIRSYAYRFIVTLIQNIMDKEQSFSKSEEEVNRSAFINTAKLLDNSKVDSFAVIIPYFKSRYSDTTTQHYLRIRELLNEVKINCLDLHGRFENIDNPAWRLNEDDWIHPSEKGHKIISESIFEYLLEHVDLTSVQKQN